MKKKLIVTLLALLALWSAAFAVDCRRCLSLREPIFVLAGETADDGGSGIYYGFGYTVKMEKHIDAEGGAVLDAVELRLLGKTVAAAIT